MGIENSGALEPASVTQAPAPGAAMEVLGGEAGAGWRVDAELERWIPLRSVWQDGRSELAATGPYGRALLDWLDQMVAFHRVYARQNQPLGRGDGHRELAVAGVATTSYLLIGDSETASDRQLELVKQLTMWLARTYQVPTDLDWYEYHWFRGQWAMSRPNQTITDLVATAVNESGLLPTVPVTQALLDATGHLAGQVTHTAAMDWTFAAVPGSHTHWLGQLMAWAATSVPYSSRPERLPGASNSGHRNPAATDLPPVFPSDLLHSAYLTGVSALAGLVAPFRPQDVDLCRRIFRHAIRPYANDPGGKHVVAGRWRPAIDHRDLANGFDQRIDSELAELAAKARHWTRQESQRFAGTLRVASLASLTRDGYPSARDVDEVQDRWNQIRGALNN